MYTNLQTVNLNWGKKDTTLGQRWVILGDMIAKVPGYRLGVSETGCYAA